LPGAIVVTDRAGIERNTTRPYSPCRDRVSKSPSPKKGATTPGFMARQVASLPFQPQLLTINSSFSLAKHDRKGLNTRINDIQSSWQPAQPRRVSSTQQYPSFASPYALQPFALLDLLLRNYEKTEWAQRKISFSMCSISEPRTSIAEPSLSN
jgi:hypothetical protein